MVEIAWTSSFFSFFFRNFFCSFTKGLLTIAGVGFLAGGALTIGRPRGFWLGHCGGFLVLLWCFFGHKDQVRGELQGCLNRGVFGEFGQILCFFIETMRGVVCKEMLQLQAIVIHTLEVQPPFLIGWFTDHHFVQKGAKSSSNGNQHFYHHLKATL